MKYIVLIIFFITLQVQAETQVVNCSASQCNLENVSGYLPDTKNCNIDSASTPSTQTYQICDENDSSYTSIRNSSTNVKDLYFLSDTNQKTRSFSLYTSNGAYPGSNLSIMMNARNDQTKGANFVVIGDNFNNVDVNLNGFIGAKGKDASEICADHMKLGDNAGGYGLAAQNFFNNRRLSGSSNPGNPTRCDVFDYNFLQSNAFRCESGYSDVTASPVVPVSRVREQSRCSTVGFYSVCVKKTLKLNCTYKLYSTTKNRELQATDLMSPSNAIQLTPRTRVYSLTEYDFQSESLRLGGANQLCEQLLKNSSLGTQERRDFYGGVSYAGSTQAQTVTGGVEINGIPREYVPYTNTGGPAAYNLNWKELTATQYSPLVISTQPIYSMTFIGTTYWYGPNPPQCTGEWCFAYYRPAGSFDYIYRGAIWKASSATYQIQGPGFGPDDQTLLSASPWQVYKTSMFRGCAEGWANHKTFYVNLIQYTDKNNVQCLGITDPLDPENRAQWQYTGVAQELDFGIESVSCGLTACAVNSSISESSYSLENIIPQSGENGTNGGRGLFFIYDMKNYSSQNVSGTAGTKGANDISIVPQNKVCVKVDDASAGINTPQAKQPFVTFKRYAWQAVRSTVPANNGTGPTASERKVEVFKKLDPSVRYFLQKHF